MGGDIPKTTRELPAGRRRGPKMDFEAMIEDRPGSRESRRRPPTAPRTGRAQDKIRPGITRCRSFRLISLARLAGTIARANEVLRGARQHPAHAGRMAALGVRSSRQHDRIRAAILSKTNASLADHQIEPINPDDIHIR